jgi:hypothetical protein
MFRRVILLFNSFELAQTLKRSTALSMFYIACCKIVLMFYNSEINTLLSNEKHHIIKKIQFEMEV